MIAAGADLDIKNKHKKTPLSVAKLYKNDELEDLIKKIQKKKIKRANLQDLIDQFLPYLNKISEEEEEEEEVKKKASKITSNKKQEISSNENNNIQKEDSYSTSKLKSPINIDNSSSENISIETYQYILDSLSQLRARVDNLSNTNNSNDNSNNNNNNNYEDEGEDEYIDEETFNSICNYIKQISSRISNLESDSTTTNNSKEQPKENFKSLSDVLDGIRNLNARISHIDSHPETNQESRADNVIATESAAKQEIAINGENIIKNENIEQSEDVGNDQNVNLIDKSSPTQSTNVAQNTGNHDIDKIDVDTIKEEFDFDDDDEVESILIGSGACCDVCGDPAIKMCNVCHHKFCQICIGSTKHIEYHLELDDE